MGVTTVRLWAGVLAAPAAWLVAEAVGYTVAARICEPSVGLATAPAATHARIVNLIVCAVCLAIAVAGLAAAVANVRDTRTRESGRPSFLAVGGVFSSAVFTAGIALFAVPSLIVNVCNQAR